jgi:serine/threonine protein kinase/formylglycine-generating enzyme required for sulfatase activity
MLCFRCGSYNPDEAPKCLVCGQELGERGGKATGALRRTTTSSQHALIFAPGELVAGRYKILDLIGHGGVGAVYKAHDTEVDVDVALKGVSPNLLQTDEEQKQFSKAIKTARKLQHPNIVRIYDEGSHLQPSRRFFTMKLLEGLSLRKVIRLRHDKAQAFSAEELGPIFQQLGAALDHAHKQSWHGDLKPENIIILPDLLKITDFGLIRSLPLKPFLGIAKSRSKGFPYLAPELRVEAASIDGRADVYSLGVILAEMLTGVVYEGHFSRAFTAALEQLPTRFDGLIRRAVAEHPDGRFTKASELAQELELALQALGGQPLPTPSPPRDPATATGLPRPVPQRAEAKAADSDKPRSVTPPAPEPRAARPVPPAVPDSQSEEEPSLLEIGQSQVLLLEQSAPQRAERRSLPADPTHERLLERRLQGIGPLNADDTIDEPTLRQAPGEDFETSPGSPVNPVRHPLAPGIVAASLDLLASSEIQESDASLLPPPLPDDADLDDSADVSRSSSSFASDLSTMEGRAIGAGRAPPAVPSEISSADQESADSPSSSSEAPLRSPREGPSPTSLEGDSAPAAANAFSTSSESDDLHEGMRAPTRHDVGEEIHDALTALKRSPSSESAADDDLRDALTRTAGSSVDLERPPPLPPAIDEGDDSVEAETSTVPLGSAVADEPDSPPATAGAEKAGPGSPGASPSTQASVASRTPVQPAIPALSTPFSGSMRPVSPPRVTVRQGPNPVLIAAGVGAVALVIFLGGRHLLQRDSVQREDGALVTLHPKTTPDTGAGTLDAGTLAPSSTSNDQAAVPGADADKPDANAGILDAGSSVAALAATTVDSGAAGGIPAQAAPAFGEGAPVEAPRPPGIEQPPALSADDAQEVARRERAEAEARAAAEMERREQNAANEAGGASVSQGSATAVATAGTKSGSSSTGGSSAGGGTGDGASSAAVAVAGGTCPAGMARIEAGAFTFGSSSSDPMRNFGEADARSVDVRAFCIDYYEAPNGKDAVPTTGVSWQAAKNACDRSGKRLCTEVEWERACKGPSSLRFPYGNTYDVDVCNTEDGDGQARALARPLDFKKCRSGFKVFMMAGNAEEWVQDAAGAQRILKGGAADRPDFASRCSARRAVPAKTSTSTTSFRCCADLR